MEERSQIPGDRVEPIGLDVLVIVAALAGVGSSGLEGEDVLD